MTYRQALCISPEGALRQVRAVKLCSMTKSSAPSTTRNPHWGCRQLSKTCHGSSDEKMEQGKLKYHRAFLPGVCYLLLICLLGRCTAFCGVCLYVQINVLKFPVSLSWPLPGPLAAERRLSMDFFVCICWRFQVPGFSRTHLGHMRQKEAQGAHCSVIPQAPGSLASLTSLQILMFFFYMWSRVSNCPQQVELKKKKKYTYYSLSEVESMMLPSFPEERNSDQLG